MTAVVELYPAENAEAEHRETEDANRDPVRPRIAGRLRRGYRGAVGRHQHRLREGQALAAFAVGQKALLEARVVRGRQAVLQVVEAQLVFDRHQLLEDQAVLGQALPFNGFTLGVRDFTEQELSEPFGVARGAHVRSPS